MDMLDIFLSQKESFPYETILGDVCFRFSIDPIYQIKKVEGRDFHFFFPHISQVPRIVPATSCVLASQCLSE